MGALLEIGPASQQGLSQPVLQPPWPLHAFWPLQPFLSVLQPPWPLHAFWPLHACFAPIDGLDDIAAGLFAGMSFFAHPETAKSIPDTAAATRVSGRFM